MKHLFYSILLSLAISSCISPYDFSLENNPAFLLVDGQIYDQDSCVIRLSYTNQRNNDPTNNVITDAKIQVIENGNKRINFVFEEVGQKYKPENLSFRGCKNCTYQLNIVLSNGKEYVSTIDTLKIPDSYTNIFDNYNGQNKNFGIYANLKPKNSTNLYYQTYFVNYSRCKFCAECKQCKNIEIEPDPLYGSCILKSCTPVPYGPLPNGNNLIYSFDCDPSAYDCFNFKRQRYYTIFTDNILAVGSNRTQKLLEVLLSDYNRYYVEIYQNSISADAYRYMKTLEENGQRTGTLVDPIPPIIVGNVYEKGDENKRVFGYFQVSGQQRYGYNLERSKAPTGEPLQQENPDLVYYDLRPGIVYRAPCEQPGCKKIYARCSFTSFRTNIKPLNWRD